MPRQTTQPRSAQTPPTQPQSLSTPKPSPAPSAAAAAPQRDQFGLAKDDYYRITRQIVPIAKYAESPLAGDEIPRLEGVTWPAATVGSVLAQLPPVPASVRSQLSASMQKTLRDEPRIERMIASGFRGYCDAEVVRLGEWNGRPAVVYRVSFEDFTHSYLELQLRTDNRGQAYIVDVLNHRGDVSLVEAVVMNTHADLLAAHRERPFLTAAAVAQCEAYLSLRDLVAAHGRLTVNGFDKTVADMPTWMRQHHVVRCMRLANAGRNQDFEAILAGVADYQGAFPDRICVDAILCSRGIADGLYEEAFAAGESLRAKFPKDEHVVLRMAIAKLAMDDDAEAQRLMDEAIAMRPDRNITHRGWIAYCLRWERYDLAAESLQRFDRMCEIDPDRLAELRNYDAFLQTAAGREWRTQLGERFDPSVLAGREERARL